jgi:hypothetical protein
LSDLSVFSGFSDFSAFSAFSDFSDLSTTFSYFSETDAFLGVTFLESFPVFLTSYFVYSSSSWSSLSSSLVSAPLSSSYYYNFCFSSAFFFPLLCFISSYFLDASFATGLAYFVLPAITYD